MPKKINKRIKSILRRFGFHLEPEKDFVFDIVCGVVNTFSNCHA